MSTIFIDIAFIVGKVFLGLFFVMSGIKHFTDFKPLSEYARLKKVPMPTLAVIITGLMMVVGGIGLRTWTLPIIDAVTSSWILIIFLVPTSLVMHAFWLEKDPQAKMENMRSFMNNIALAAALLIIIVLISSGL